MNERSIAFRGWSASDTGESSLASAARARAEKIPADKKHVEGILS